MLWLRGQDLNLRPSGYEPDELPTAPPRDIKLNLVIGAEDRNRTGTVSLPQDFKSCASACSATSACSFFPSPPDDKINYILCFIKCQHFFAILFIFLQLFCNHSKIASSQQYFPYVNNKNTEKILCFYLYIKLKYYISI